MLLPLGVVASVGSGLWLNSGWAARLVLAGALGLGLAQAQELWLVCGGWGGVA